MNESRPPSSLPGVRYGAIVRHADQRGSFRELWRAGDFPDEPFVQANLSTSAAGVLRGLHLHQRQDDLWIVAEGRAFVALVDLRPMLDGTGSTTSAINKPTPTQAAKTPPCLIHGVGSDNNGTPSASTITNKIVKHAISTTTVSKYRFICLSFSLRSLRISASSALKDKLKRRERRERRDTQRSQRNLIQ